jgi:hypothetical protein
MEMAHTKQHTPRMSTKNTGGSAFPTIHHEESHGVPYTYTESGMNLRDYFAAKAMQALTQSEQFVKEASEWRKIDGENIEDAIAGSAYDLADAMLKAREQ